MTESKQAIAGAKRAHFDRVVADAVKPFVPSPMQQAIFTAVKSGRGSFVVKAVAGAGKTTTAIASLEYVPDNAHVQVFAFNVTIADEFKRKLDELRKRTKREMRNMRAGTFHSVCYGAVRKHLASLGIPDCKPESNKLRKLARSAWGEDTVELYGDFTVRLVSLAKGRGIGPLVPDTEEAWYSLVRHHDLYLNSEAANEAEAVRLSRELLMLSNKVAKLAGDIDFDDMLYLVLLWKLRLWQNDLVIIDEGQDTNDVRRAVAKLALRPGGRMFAYGDQCQAIYGFTGASHDAMELLRKEFNAQELPLTCSYRCPKAVGTLARDLVPYFEVHEDAPEGLSEWGKLGDILAKLGNHDVVLCRQTAPLVALAFKCIAAGRGVQIRGKEIGQGLINLVKQMKAKSMPNLLERLDQYRNREVAKHMAKGEEGKAEGVSDRVACIETVIDQLPETERTIPKLIVKIEGLFSDSNGVLMLSTCHKAKGLEWDRVAIYRPDLMPSRWARQEHQAQEEKNLMYVAWTRARRELYFITPEKPDQEKLDVVRVKAQ